mmetsp:Transcript_13544/g.26123  ORF Transcript_13544/g.26123 Transcript_13544/m.26123 type:complete len:82 (-) Transcript_13544:2399-2644(-)
MPTDNPVVGAGADAVGAGTADEAYAGAGEMHAAACVAGVAYAACVAFAADENKNDTVACRGPCLGPGERTCYCGCCYRRCC